MYNRLNKRLRERPDAGFTLIELLIVIVILGILAAIVVFAVGSTRGDATEKACKTDFKSIELANEAYYTRFGVYGDQTKLTTGNGLLKDWPGTTGGDYSFTISSSDITVAGTKVKGGVGVDGCAAK